MAYVDPEILIWAGTTMVALIIGKKANLPWRRSNGDSINGLSSLKDAIKKIQDHPIFDFKISDKTSGAHHISDETKEKIEKIETSLKNEYLTGQRHTDLCNLQVEKMKSHVSETVINAQTQILEAISKIGD